MSTTLQHTVNNGLAVVALNRGKSNPINQAMIDELLALFNALQANPAVRGVLLTGQENFFSAGVDLPEVYNYNHAQMLHFWQQLMRLQLSLASFSKPMVAAITGHSPAGGCLLALCADYRVMANNDKYVIGLNELPVGITVPASVFHLYAFWLGQRKASQLLLEGKLLNPTQALEVGLIDELCPPQSILTIAERKVRTYMQFNSSVWGQTKLNIRQQLLQQLATDQTETINHMLKHWFEPQHRALLQSIISNFKSAN